MNEPFYEQIQQQIGQYLQHYIEPNYILEQSQLARDSKKNNYWEDRQQSQFDETYATALIEVLEPIQKLIFLPGKRWRPSLTLLHALLPQQVMLQEQNEIFSPLINTLVGPVVALVELLHNATLIADDIEDNSSLRRGIPALHISHGLDRSLNACNWAYFLPALLLKPIEKAGHVELAFQLQGLFMQCLNDIHLGQALDIRWHRQREYIPNREEYFCMASLKTGALAGFAARIGTLLCQVICPNSTIYPALAPKLCQQLWQRVGRAFQVLDDVMNITIGNPGKLRGDDWLEGKKSLPLCLFVHQNKSQSQGEAEIQTHRINFIISWIEKIQQGKLSEQSNDLENVLEEFTSKSLGGWQAIADSLSWLEQELLSCRQIAFKLYSPFIKQKNDSSNLCTKELLRLLGKLQAEAQRCRNFIHQT